MFSVINSIGLFGMNAFPVTVEAEVTSGHPQFDISGLPDAVIRESRERVRSAVLSAKVPFPKGRVLVNLAPADVKKTGSSFDLAIFVALMQSIGVLRMDLSHCIFAGELGLNGGIYSIKGVLSVTMLAKKNGFREIYVPMGNVKEAAVIDGIEVYGVNTVTELLHHLCGQRLLQPAPLTVPEATYAENVLDFRDVRGQHKARCGMELAAAGGHNILLVGSPGSGKSMLASRLPSILPKMNRAEILETTNMYSVAGQLSAEHPLITERPFRSPHHTVSSAGLIGGGSIPAPGEISMAHNGVLFLDELAEFDRTTLEILRQPLEIREVTISRAAGTAVYPCNIMLVAAMNPCPCGYFGSTQKKCICAPKQVQRYLSRISGPLLDRFDLHIDVDPVPYEALSSDKVPESSAEVRERVEAARDRQKVRFQGSDIHCNAMIPDRLLGEFCHLDSAASDMLKMVYERFGLSARTHVRLQKVALSSADLHGRDTVQKEDIATAVQFRGLDSKYLR